MSLLNIVCPYCLATNRIDSSRLAMRPGCDSCKQPLFSGRPSKLTARNISTYLTENDIPVVVNFWSPSCEVNKAMEPAFAKATLQLEPWVRLTRVNVELERSLPRTYHIRSTPTLLLFKSEKEVDRKSGLMSASDIMSWVSSKI